MKRRTAVAALPALAFAVAARGQDAASPAASASQPASPARRYVALSIVSDRLQQLAGGSPGGTGTMIGSHRLNAVPLPNGPLDRIALTALAAAVQQADPGASVGGLSTSEASHFSDQDDWFSGNQLKLPDALRKAVEGEHAQRLLLVTKHRGLALVSDGTQSEGPAHGRFEGLGLYFNGDQRMVGGGQGFMAPFVFVTLSVVDANTFAVLGRQVIESSHPMPSNAGQGIVEISHLLSDAIATTMPKLIAAAQVSN